MSASPSSNSDIAIPPVVEYVDETTLNRIIDQAIHLLFDGVKGTADSHFGEQVATGSDRTRLELRFLKFCSKPVNDRILHHIHSLGTGHNSQLPIYSLPNELLLQIFNILLHEDVEEPGDYYSTLQGLACVSSRWAAIILQAPSLWAYVPFADPHPPYTTIFTRSNNLPLHVVFDESLQHSSDIESFREAVRLQTHRLKSLKVVGDPSELDLEDFSSSVAPRLEDLEVDCRNCGYSEEIDLLGGEASRLRHLRLYEYPIPWDSGLLSHLQTLVIRGSDGFMGPSSAQVMHAIRACPLLVRLELEYQEVDGEGDSEEDEDEDSDGDRDQGQDEKVVAEIYPPIHLSHLKTLSIQLQSQMVRSILETIRIPRCESFQAHGSGQRIEVFSKATVHLIPVFTRLTQAAHVIDFFLAIRGIVCTWRRAGRDSPEPIFDLKVEETQVLHAVGALGWLTHHLPPTSFAAPSALHIAQDGLYYKTLVVAHRLRSVTSLRLTSTGHDYGILQTMSRPQLWTDGYGWIFPNLRRLSVNGCWDVEPHVLISMLEARLGRTGSNAGSSEEQGQAAAAALPVPLTQLVLRSRDGDRTTTPHELLKLQEMVQDVCWGDIDIGHDDDQ